MTQRGELHRKQKTLSWMLIGLIALEGATGELPGPFGATWFGAHCDPFGVLDHGRLFEA